MTNALVLVEQKDGTIKKSSLEVIHTFKEQGFEVSAVCFGENLSALSSKLAAQAGDQGASKCYLVSDSELKFYQPEIYKESLAKIFSDGGFTVLSGAATSLVKDLFPTMAIKLEAGLVVDGVSLKNNGGQLSVKKPQLAG